MSANPNPLNKLMEIALVTTILTYLPQITTGVSRLILWVREARAAAKQKGEWTPELEAEFIAKIESRKDDPAYQPDQT